MKRIIIPILLTLFCSFAAFAQSQYLDLEFGRGGIMTDIPNIQPCGRLISLDSGKFLDLGRTTVGKVNETGTLDTTYLDGGFASFSFFTDKKFTGAHFAFLPDGKPVFIGNMYRSFSGGRDDIALARFKADFSGLDSSFCDSGYLVHVAPDNDKGVDVGLQSDGKIIAYGEVGAYPFIDLIRYLPNGIKDTTFANKGEMIYKTGRNGMDAVRLFVLPDDRILVGADAYRDTGGIDFLVMRFLPDGRFDTSFNHTGSAFADLAGLGYGFLRDIVLQKDGKIVLCGGSFSHDGFHIVRLNADGSRDFSFNKTGELYFTVDGSGCSSHLALQDDGKIVVAGYYGANEDLAVVRLHTDGRFDTSFGKNGTIQYSEPGMQLARLYQLIISRGNRPQVITSRRPANNTSSSECVIYRFKPYGFTSIDNDPKIVFHTSLFAFPNPARHSVTLRSDKKLRSVAAVDAGGKSVPLRPVPGAEDAYDIRSLAAGVYVLQCLVTDGEAVSTTLMVDNP